MPETPRKRARSLAELDEIFARLAVPGLIDESIASYKPRPSDVVITPFGKCGTTWTQQIVHTLRTRGDVDFDDISRVVPWIETSGILNLDINAEQIAAPRAFKSHLGYDRVPKGARYINVIRHPVDRAFSSFKFMEGWYFEPGSIGADEYVINGAESGAYQNHLVSWWPHRNDGDVLYLVFEHMKNDLERTIEKIAAFIGIELDDELRAICLEHGSLPFMQEHRHRFDDALMRRRTEEVVLPVGSDSNKVRAGQVGVYELGTETIKLLDRLWSEIVVPVTGFKTYEALIESLD